MYRPPDSMSIRGAGGEGGKALFAVGLIAVIVVAGYFMLFQASIIWGQQTLQENVTGGIPPYQYQWYVGKSCSVPLSGETNQNLTINSTPMYAYSVKIVDAVNTTSCFNFTWSP